LNLLTREKSTLADSVVLGMEYAMAIMHTDIVDGVTINYLELPRRVYTFQGGTQVEDLNENGIIEALRDDPRTEAVGDAINEAEVPWCFDYGEEDWLNPNFSLPDPLDPEESSPATFLNYLSRAVSQPAFRNNCL